MSDDSLKEAGHSIAEPTKYKSPYAPLIDELYREEVLEARKMSPTDKFLLGESLFLSACEITLAAASAMRTPGSARRNVCANWSAA